MTNERIAAITAARHLLESNASVDSEQICSAIVCIGKPYDSEVIEALAAIVGKYLDHPDHVVRHQAVWFLSSWGHLPEYASRIRDAACMDSEVDNRAFAAKSLGSILKLTKDPSLTRNLLAFVEDERETVEVRSSAYSGLLYAWNRDEAFAFLLGDKAISEVDREFIMKLHGWVQGKMEMPPVNPSGGVLRSLFHAVRADLI